MITILVIAFLTMSAICTAVLIAACVVAKRSEEVIESSSPFIKYEIQYEKPMDAVPPQVAVKHQRMHAPAHQPVAKAASS